jgi:hypothetical protein
MASTARTFGPRESDFTGGSFSWAGFTGIIGAAISANSEIFQFRWMSTAKHAVIRRVELSAAVTTTMFAAGVPVRLDLVKSIDWSAVGTGGTEITMAALNKRKASMSSSVLVALDARIATTAALGAGTKTLEGNSLAAILAGGPITGSLAGTIFPAGTILWESKPNEPPLTLVGTEGFSIRAVSVPATGTWAASVKVDWDEVTAY